MHFNVTEQNYVSILSTDAFSQAKNSYSTQDNENIGTVEIVTTVFFMNDGSQLCFWFFTK